MNREPPILPELWRHQTWLRRFARGLVGDREAADDVVQETLVAAWQHPPELDRDVRPWLAQVARNQVRDHARSETSRRARESVAGEAATSEGGAPSVEDALVDGDLHRELADVVAGLDEPFRQTLFQRYYEGLTAAEIARRLGVPSGTVRWRLKEGLDRARRQLDQRNDGDRRKWMRAIAPLLPASGASGGAGPRPGVSPLVTAAKVFTLLAGAAVIAVGWRVVSLRRSMRSTVAAPTAATVVAGDGERGAPGRGPSLVASGSEARTEALRVAACWQRVERSHEDLGAMERDLFQWDMDFVFALGGPNPTAEAALQPFVAGALAKESGRVLEHRFACRTWGCRLAMRKPAPGSAGPFSGGDTLQRAVTVKATRATSALGLEERPGTFIHVDHIPLKQPSAEPPPDGERRFPDPRPRPGRPATAEACEALQRTLDTDTADLRARWLALEPREHLFQRSTTRNPQLEAEVNALLPWWKKVLVHFECRGQVCYRVPYLGRLPHSLWKLTPADEAALLARYQVTAEQSGAHHYLELKPRERGR